VTTGAKVAIGCGIAILAAGMVVVVALGGAAWWAKGKVEQVTGEQERIEELQKKANRNEFQKPGSGVIAEDRLLTFLEVRKRVYGVYQKYQRELEARGRKEQADFGDVTRALGMVNEIRLAQAQAQADLGMSEDEYRWLVEQVYKTMWAAEVAKATGGKSVSEAAAEAYDRAAQEMARAAETARQAQRSAKAAGDRAAEEASEESEEEVEEGAEKLKKEAAEVRGRARDMDVPPANIELFRRHEADIKRYAMSGLEWIGL
jgi:hypothetical protein